MMIMVHQMRALGHDAKWAKNNAQICGAGNGYNIIVEGFTKSVVDIVAEMHRQGARFICLATEEPTERGFNHGTQPEMVKRQEVFPEAAKFFDGILHLVPGEHVTRWYSQFAPAAYADLGYAPSLIRYGTQFPEYDFGFYGSATPRRMSILKRLAKMVRKPKAVRLCADFKTQDERDVEMRKAKVIVQIRKFEAMGLVSSSRCNTAICLGRPVVAEPHDLCKPWDEVVTFTKSLDAFYSAALMARATWQGMHAAQLAKFKEKMSPQRCIGDALEAIGIPSPRAAAA